MTALTVATARRDSLVRYARRYTHSNDAAEDAVQAATLIALERPDVTGPSVYAWLKTVVRHEAYRCGRMVGDVALEDLPEVGTEPPDIDELMDVRAALAALRPDERRALIGKASGLSYAELAEVLDWTYTKVNRCLTEGRRAARESLTLT